MLQHIVSQAISPLHIVQHITKTQGIDFISERRKNRNSINSIEGFYNYNSVNNFLFEEKGEKLLVYDNENTTTINDKEYANNFNLAFRSKNLFDNEEPTKKLGSRKVSQDEDFLFNYMMH